MRIKSIRELKKYVFSLATQQRTVLGIKPSEVYIRLSLLILLSICFFGFLFLAFAQTDEVVSASGQLSPVGKERTIQMPQGGVVEQLHVKDGDSVVKGQVLVTLNGEVSGEVLKATKESIKAKRSEISHKSKEFEKYLQGNDLQQKFLRRSIQVNSSILGKFRQLAKSGAMAEVKVLEQEINLEREKSSLAKLLNERLEEQAKSDQSIERLNSELQELISRLAEIEYRSKNTIITSQIDGFVFDLKPKGTSFVGQGTEPLMKIVPNGKLHALVYVSSDKIGFVRSGQISDISIDSFPASDFGSLKGKVIQIGSSSLPPDDQYPYFRYPVVISLSAQQLMPSKRISLPLKAGMSIVANLKLRKVSYLQLLLSDFKDKTDSLKKI